jgi:hypothetical protein
VFYFSIVNSEDCFGPMCKRRFDDVLDDTVTANRAKVARGNNLVFVKTCWSVGR